MSTVVLTPTHLASDHAVVQRTFPMEARVDLDYRKIFIAPHKKFMIGTTGEFVPSDIDTPAVWDSIGIILSVIVSNLAVGNMFEDEIVLNFEKGNDFEQKAIKEYARVMDAMGKTFIVSKHYRFVIWFSGLMEHWKAKRIGSYAGIGTGGAIAAGMLAGGMKIGDVWEPLHRLDYHSSAQYTAIPLSTLKPTTALNKQLQAMRNKHD